MILGKSFKNIEFEDIFRLVNNNVCESRYLDYKQDINLEKGDDRKEFLFDISSFANSEGGVIIYGISEQLDENNKNTGLPDEILGLKNKNIDALILQIEDLIRTSIEPNISDIVIKSLEKGNTKLLFIGISKSMGLPRMVTYKSSNKFYKRRNSGKYLVDVYELNQMFMQNIELVRELDLFREKRLNDVRTGKFLSGEEINDITLLHITPVSHFRYSQISLTDEDTISYIRDNFHPIGIRGGESRSNFEGFLLYSINREQKISSYNQIFRNGIIEFFTNRFHYTSDTNKSLKLPYLEVETIECIENAILLYKKLEISPPFVVHLTLTNLKNRYIDSPTYRWHEEPYFINDDLLIPNIIINDYDDNIEGKLKDIFDIVWQSGGIRKSPFYNELGKRRKT